MKKLITVLFACRLMILATSAQAQVAGHITTDTTWTDTVNIVGDVYVDNSVTLVIEPGTVVRLNGHYKIDVKGNIAASGTASDSITFTVADTTGFHNNTHVGWNRIIYDNVQQSNDSTIFRYCIFEYGKTSGNGGAMYLNNFYTDNDSTKLDISHCTFRKNYAQKGGAVYFWQYSKKSIVFKHNLITANKALNRGGGLYINFANTNVFKADFIDSCRILNNSVTNGNGGGICFGRDAKEGEMKEPGGKDEEKFKNIFRNCEIAYNSASAHGGGICSDNFTVLYQRAISLENCLIHHNTALGNGGGIWANEIVLKNCVIFENEAVNGGGLYGKEIYSVIVNNLIRDNIASGNGGGCVFKDNSEFADIANNTITGNHADNYGGGLFLDYSSPAFVNCIISGNEADNGGDNVGINDDPSDPGFSYCVLEGGRESIQGPGGGSLYTGLYYGVISRPARFVMTGGHPYQPAFNSPGIDDGNPDTTGMMLPQICMDGNPRIFDNTFDIIDIGCYESRFDTLDNYYFTGGHTDIDLAAYDTLGIGSSITFDSGLAFSTTEGAYIEFYGNYNLVFNKNIQVIGTEQGPITFTCYDTTGFYNHTHTGWNGIQLNNADIGATAEFSHCIFEYVKTEDGALSSSQIDSLFVDHCLFQYNQRDSTGFYGTSCIYLYEISFCKISHSSFLYSNNSDNANLHFWLFNTDANVEIDHCNFIDNRNLNSSGRGGAIRMDEGTSLTITNSLFVDNYAHRYGASYSWPIDTKIFNCTFTDNTSWGGTVGCQNAHVENSIFYGNHHTVSSKQLIVSAGSVVKNCNIEGEPSGGGITISGLINSNPRFLGYGEYPYSLSPYSNCINAGSIDTTGLNLSATDLAGNPRIYNGNQGRIDMGAYEYQGDPPPRVQTCLDFDGANDYVSGTGIDTTLTAITLEAWVNHDTLPVEIQRYITVQPEMAVIRYDGFFGYRSLHFYIKKADGALYGIRADSVLTPGEWTHVAGTYDGTIMKLYVNGELIKSASPAGGLFPSNGGFSISGGEAMDGRIDQVRIWSVARTANEIREDMHVEIPMYQLGLVSYWNFDEGDGNMTYDRYGINDGTLQNMDNADWVVSSMPFGEGVSDSKTEIPGLVDFTGTDLIMDFNAQNGAEITVSRIDALPNIFPAGPDHVFDGQYWVVHRYGTGNFDADLTFTLSEDLTAEDMANPGNISLYTRGSTADTAWAFLASAGLVNAANNTATFENITGFSQFIIAREINLGIELNLSAYLEGPFNGTEMNTNIFGYLPLSQPYNTAPWNYTGTEAVAAIPNTDVVDWILVELRDAPDAASAGSAAVVARQAGFLLKDGSVVSIDGQSMLQFAGLSVQHSIFAVVRHRNHIAVMSAIPLTESGGVYSYDFTTGAVQAHGGTLAHKEIAPGIWGLTAADGNADNQVNNGDKNDVWAPQAGTGGYTSGDFNLDAQVNNGDKNDMWAPNTGLGGQVPQ